MKKILCIALCVMMVLSVFAGCSQPQPGNTEPAPSGTKHVHKWSDSYQSNETSHWKQCEGCSLQANAGAHIDDNMDGKCEDCGYEEACEHTFNEDEWKSDKENHWHAATCKHEGVKGSLAAHVDENNDGICEVCEYIDPDHEHSYESGWSSDAADHWHDASCGHDVVSDKAAHEDLNNDGQCDTCEYADPNHTHTFDETRWEVDAGNHWHAPTCEHTGAMQDAARHEDNDVNGYCDTCNYLMCTHSDYNVDGVCDICGYEDPDHSHTFADAWVSNHTGHWKTAECHPGATTQIEAHKDVNKDGICDTCAFVVCSHTYKSSWSSDDTHHWHQITCTCIIERKDYGEHVDADGINGCDICMHGYEAPAPYEMVMDKELVTINQAADAYITWQAVTIHIEKPGRYLVTSDNTQVRWCMAQYQEEKPTSYATEMYFEEAGEITIWAYYFDMAKPADPPPFDIHLTVMYLDDLVLNTSRGKTQIPTNMVYKVVFEAVEVGTWTLSTGVDNVDMGTTVDNMELTKSVEINVVKPGDEVVLYIRYDDSMNAAFLFDWELSEPFQLNVGEGMSPVSVPAVGDDYKVVFTAPADGQYLLSVTSEYLSFSEWGLGGFSAPVRIESNQQLTPELKAGETFTTWLQTVYDYPMSTNVNDTLNIINVGTLLDLGSSLKVDETIMGLDDLLKVRSHYAITDGTLKLSVVNGTIGVKAEDGQIQWLAAEEVDGQQVCRLTRQMKAEESLEYYINILDPAQNVVLESDFEGTVKEETLGLTDILKGVTTHTAQVYGVFDLAVVNALVGVKDAQGQIQWLETEEVDGQQVAKLSGEMQADESIVYYVVPLDAAQAVTRTFSFQRLNQINMAGNFYSFTADETSYYNISVENGEIGVTINGVTQWVAAKEVDGKMISSYEVKVEKGDTYVFQIRGEDGLTAVEANAVKYEFPLQLGEHDITMVPSKEYDIVINPAMLNYKVTLSCDYKGVTIYVDGERYVQGTEIALLDVRSITARLQNNEPKTVKFTITATNNPGQGDAVSSNATLEVGSPVIVRVPAGGGSGSATFTATMGGTYTLQCKTEGVTIYLETEDGTQGEHVISGADNYVFHAEAGEVVTFIIRSNNSQQIDVDLTLHQGEPPANA